MPGMSVHLDVIGTDIDGRGPVRARCGYYPRSSVQELPPDWIEAGFDRLDDGYVVREGVRTAVGFKVEA
jgi:chemotaxis methyl-accepting protein methylase